MNNIYTKGSPDVANCSCPRRPVSGNAYNTIYQMIIAVNLQHINPDSPPPMFSTFSTVTEDQVTKIITNSPSKSCSLGPRPTFLVLDYLDILITPITSIIDASYKQAKCRNFFKRAHVTPILKKSSLDKEVFKTTGLSPIKTLSQIYLKG